jgi:hypothetical protein
VGGALCPRHGGLIGQRGDKEGMLFLCTTCGKYRRYAKNNSSEQGEAQIREELLHLSLPRVF